MSSTDWMLVVAIAGILLLMAIGYAGLYFRYRMLGRKENYRNIPTKNLAGGKEAAERLMAEYDISGVEIKQIDNVLLEYYYSPRSKQLHLSVRSYHGVGLYQVARAAHTAAHAVQHERAYPGIDVYLFFAPIMEVWSRLFPLFVIVLFIMGSCELKWAFVLLLLLYAVSFVVSLLMRRVDKGAADIAKEWLLSHDHIYQKDMEALDKTMKAIIDYNFIAILTAGFTIFQSKRGWLNSSATV